MGRVTTYRHYMAISDVKEYAHLSAEDVDAIGVLAVLAHHSQALAAEPVPQGTADDAPEARSEKMFEGEPTTYGNPAGPRSGLVTALRHRTDPSQLRRLTRTV